MHRIKHLQGFQRSHKMNLLIFWYLNFLVYGEDCLKSRDSLMECACRNIETAKMCITMSNVPDAKCQKCQTALGWISLKMQCSGLRKNHECSKNTMVRNLSNLPTRWLIRREIPSHVKNPWDFKSHSFLANGD